MEKDALQKDRWFRGGDMLIENVKYWVGGGQTENSRMFLKEGGRQARNSSTVSWAWLDILFIEWVLAGPGRQGQIT